MTGYSKARLAATCGRNRERAAEVADRYGIPQVFTDYRETIRTAVQDAVVVSTPDDLHHNKLRLNRLERALPTAWLVHL